MNGKARMEITVYPLGTYDADIAKDLAGIFNVLDVCRLPYQVTTMGTTVEGTLDELFTLARNLHDSVFSDTVRRVVTIMRIDERRQ